MNITGRYIKYKRKGKNYPSPFNNHYPYPHFLNFLKSCFVIVFLLIFGIGLTGCASVNRVDKVEDYPVAHTRNWKMVEEMK